jgi:hypothetical protein
MHSKSVSRMSNGGDDRLRFTGFRRLCKLTVDKETQQIETYQNP